MSAPYRPESHEPMEPVGTADPERGGQGIPLPIARPMVTRILLGAIIFVFVIETIVGDLIQWRSLGAAALNNILNGSMNVDALVVLGAQVNPLVAQGQYWRLLTAMFLHIGIMHILFNGWALLVLGREVEGYYGARRFITIYLLAGLSGSVLSFALGPSVMSAGASGAIFGLFGADIAFFLSNRKGLGRFSQRQLGNLFVVLLINLFLGFSVPGIDYFAHIGGLIAGLILGFGMSPRYTAVWDLDRPRLINRTTAMQHVLAVVALVVLLAGGLSQGLQKWSSGSNLPDQPQALVVPGPSARD